MVEPRVTSLDSALALEICQPLGAVEHEDLLSSIVRVVRAELKMFGAKLQKDLKREPALPSMMPHRSKIMVSGQSDARGEGGRGHARDADIGGSGQPHAWVSRNMRSYAAAAELADLDLASARRSPELLPDKIAKGSGPLARSRRRAASAAGDSPRSHRWAPSRVAFDSETSSNDGGKWAERRERKGDRNATLSSGAPSGAESFHSVGTDFTVSPSIMPCMPVNTMLKSGTGTQSAMMSSRHSSDRPPSEVEEADEDEARPAKGPWMGKSFHRMSTIQSMKESFVSAVITAGHDEHSHLSCASLCGNIVRNLCFENMTMVFILANAFTIGIQTDLHARTLNTTTPPALVVINLIIACFFGIELIMRLAAYRWKFFTMPGWKWNVMDLFIVALQIIDEVMEALTFASSVPIALSLVRMLRILRLVRIIRIVRLLKYMSELRTIVVSMSHSMKPLVSTIMLLALVVYVVGIYFTQITLDYRIDNRASRKSQQMEVYFGSVGTAVMSLFQTVTGGLEWRHMVLPLMENISPFMGAVFALYIVFTSLALMNIVTGVFVETALQRGREDKDVYMINHLKDLFGVLDENSNGTITWFELQAHLNNPKLKTFFRDIDIDISEAKGLFHMLDRDESGTIDADEFLSGCLRLRGPAKALDLQLVMLELADQRKTFQKLMFSLDMRTEETPVESVTTSLAPT